MSRIQAHGSSAWWQAALVLAPLIILTALGVHAVQLSRRATLDSARIECGRVIAEIGKRFTLQISELRENRPPATYPATPNPAEPEEAQELFRIAANLQPAEVGPRLISLAENHPQARTESGLPLLPLIAWRQLRSSADPEEIALLAEKLARIAVETHPSIITSELLERTSQLLGERGVDDVLQNWIDRWSRDEEMRAVLDQNGDKIAALDAPLWVEGERDKWWVEPDGAGNVRLLLPRATLAAAARSSVSAVDARLPEYAKASIKLQEVELLDANDDQPILARTEARPIVVAAFLSDPGKLYRQQMIQSVWLGTLLACASAAALAGFWVLRRSLARERQLGELKSNFVASVSHELRAPIASMRVMAENLESGVVSAPARREEYHRLISEECRRLSSLIDNVLEFARIEQNRKTYRFAETDVTTLVRETAQLMEARAAQREQRIEVALEMIDTPVTIDGMAIQQALINLLDNAIKFSPRGATIALRLRTRGNGEWEVSVTDSGPGIPRSEQAKIFERFYRIGSELCRETQGAGIGLSIVEHIVKGHGGRVEIESEPGAGATFTVILPLNARNETDNSNSHVTDPDH